MKYNYICIMKRMLCRAQKSNRIHKVLPLSLLGNTFFGDLVHVRRERERHTDRQRQTETDRECVYVCVLLYVVSTIFQSYHDGGCLLHETRALGV